MEEDYRSEEESNEAQPSSKKRKTNEHDHSPTHLEDMDGVADTIIIAEHAACTHELVDSDFVDADGTRNNAINDGINVIWRQNNSNGGSNNRVGNAKSAVTEQSYAEPEITCANTSASSSSQQIPVAIDGATASRPWTQNEVPVTQ